MFWNRRKYKLDVKQGERGKWWWTARDAVTGKSLVGSRTPGFSSEEKARIHAGIVMHTNWKLAD